MTYQEKRRLNGQVLKRVRRELADVPHDTEVKVSWQTYRWTGREIEFLITRDPEEEWERQDYLNWPLSEMKRTIAAFRAFRKTLASRESRREERRLQALKDWAEQ